MQVGSRYSDALAKEDVRNFFENPEHWVYGRGRTPAICNHDWPYHISQLEVLFEDRYFHWVTSRAVHSLIEEGFLRSEEVQAGPAAAIFVWRRNLRYVRRLLRESTKLVAAYSSPEVSRMIGDHAEDLVYHALRALHFSIVGRNTQTYQGRRWTKTGHDLDFVVERDGIAYGVEGKNTFPYMPQDEFAIKLDMCSYLDILPLFIVRARPRLQLDAVRAKKGIVYMFKSKMFPRGQEQFAARLWEMTRLPVDIAWTMPETFGQVINQEHHRSLRNN